MLTDQQLSLTTTWKKTIPITLFNSNAQDITNRIPQFFMSLLIPANEIIRQQKSQESVFSTDNASKPYALKWKLYSRRPKLAFLNIGYFYTVLAYWVVSQVECKYLPIMLSVYCIKMAQKSPFLLPYSSISIKPTFWK